MHTMIEGKSLLIPVTVLILGSTAAVIYNAGGYLPALPALMSPTANAAFILFSLVFASSSLLRLLPNNFTRYLMRNRRYIGLSFALIHFTHLAFVLSNITLVAGEGRDIGTIIPGFIAYVFITLMALTSNDVSQRKLGIRRWTLLHKVGGYYIWLIFLATTLPPSPSTVWMLLISISVLGLRILDYQRRQTI
jgi:DMSO/TMAO reductase YedYZ heme-binding membrane subunit